MEIWCIEMNIAVTVKIDDALSAVRKFITAHQQGNKNAPLSLVILTRVQGELESMKRDVPLFNYTPTYPRFVMDWPDDTGLVKQLIDVAYDYKKLKGQRS